MDNTDRSLRILRLPAVKQRTGLGHDTIYRGAREGWFPKPIKISQWASGWIESEIDAYIADKIANRDAQPVNPIGAKAVATESAAQSPIPKKFGPARCGKYRRGHDHDSMEVLQAAFVFAQS